MSHTSFFALSLKRAFRVEMSPDEILPSERQALLMAPRPVTSPKEQAFLAWRRSLLFVIAVLMVPVTVLSAIETFTMADEMPDGLPGMDTFVSLHTLVFLVGVGFTITMWVMLGSWTQWRRQRRILIIAWAVYFLAPFLVFLYPLRSLAPEGEQAVAVLLGMLGSISAFMELAPSAISLMPGAVRAATVSKLLFPGASAPGWLMVVTTPIYGLLIYIVLLTPYQLTGNGLFIVGIGCLLGSQVWLGRAGYALARPLPLQQARAGVRRARQGYLIGNLLGLVFIGIAVSELMEMMDLPILGMVEALVTLLAKIMLLTLVTTDIMLTGLERARGMSGDAQAVEMARYYEQQLAEFMRVEEAPSGTGQMPPSAGHAGGAPAPGSGWPGA